MSYNSTVLAVREVLRQTVHNLDVQRDALTTAATQADRDFNTTDHYRYLVEAFRELDKEICPWSDPDECSTARERSVAGTSRPVPACPVHGPFKETL